MEKNSYHENRIKKSNLNLSRILSLLKFFVRPSRESDYTIRSNHLSVFFLPITNGIRTDTVVFLDNDLSGYIPAYADNYSSANKVYKESIY